MAEPALTLRDHPQIIDLISVLEQSGLQKQKEEVQALVGYIDGMEEKLSQMMDEMKKMRLEVGKLHDKGIRARCSQLADTVEGKVRQTKVMVSTAKENLISSAKQMVQTFREKGRSALCHAAQALHIPSVLSRMGRGFAHSEKSMGQLAVRLDSMPLRERNPRKARNYLRIRVCLPSCGALCCLAARCFRKWNATWRSRWSESMAGAHR